MTALQATGTKASSAATRSGRQGMTDQIVMSWTPGSFGTVLAPRGSSKPEWLAR